MQPVTEPLKKSDLVPFSLASTICRKQHLIRTFPFPDCAVMPTQHACLADSDPASQFNHIQCQLINTRWSLQKRVIAAFDQGQSGFLVRVHIPKHRVLYSIVTNLASLLHNYAYTHIQEQHQADIHLADETLHSAAAENDSALILDNDNGLKW